MWRARARRRWRAREAEGGNYSMTDLKPVARALFERTIAGIDARRALCNKLERRGNRLTFGDWSAALDDFDSIRVAAVGKAGAAMAEGLDEVLAPEYAVEGVLAVPSPPQHPIGKLRLFVAGHPVPNEESFEAARSILEMLSGAKRKTLVFFCFRAEGRR